MAVRIEVASASFLESDVPLLSFPLGAPPGLADMRLTLRERGAGRKRRRKAEGLLGEVRFVGADHLLQGPGSGKRHADLCHFAVGVLHDGADSMALHPVAHALVMQPCFAAQTQAEEALSYRDRVRMSTEAFGSKKKRKALKDADSNRISADNILGADQLERSLAEARQAGEGEALLGEAVQAMESHRRAMLPAFDPSATTVGAAYPALVSASAIALLSRMFCKEVLSPALGVPECVARLSASKVVRALAEGAVLTHGGREEATTGSCAPFNEDIAKVLVLHALVALHTQLQGTRKAPRAQVALHDCPAYPAAVLKKLVDDFVSVDGTGATAKYHLDPTDRHRLTMHAMVLALSVNNGSLDLAALAEDLRCPAASLAALAKEVGCETKRIKQAGAEVLVAELQLPLKFHEMRRKTRA